MDKATKSVIESVEALPQQAITAWEDSQKLEFPAEYKNARNIVICGMGGSGLPAHVIQSVFVSHVPLVLVQSYDIPAWVDDKTLVLLSSYSGTTEEVLSCAGQAKKRTKLITGATIGGDLEKFFEQAGFPAYIFDERYNPSRQPRIGTGYNIFGQAGMLYKLGYLNAVGGSIDKQIREAVEFLAKHEQRISNEAEKLAEKLRDKALIIFAADHLVGNAHVFANQTNETAKTFASWFPLSEANHHLLEGLKRPKLAMSAVFIESENYSGRMKKRFELTRTIAKKNGYEAYVYKPEKGTLAQEMLEVLFFSGMITLKLAIAYNEDPTDIGWVDFFKEELEKEG